MWQETTVNKEALEDIEGLEKSLGGRIMDVRDLGDGRALVRYAPIVDDSWFVDIWNGQATLCIIDQFGFVNMLEDAFATWDPDALQAVVDRVMQDYGVTLADTGQYYPISQEAQEAFQAFLARAKRKPRRR